MGCEAQHVLLVAAPQTLGQLLDDVLEVEGPEVLGDLDSD